MISLKKNNKGFTIVELLIVIVVIGILALLVITTYSGIQAKARNSKRQTDLASIQTHLEAFYNENGYYPNRDDMNTASFITGQMKGLDPTALVDPSNPNQATTTPFVSAPVAKSYSYQPTAADGTTACEGASPADQSCAQYKLIATYEGTVGGQTQFKKNSLN